MAPGLGDDAVAGGYPAVLTTAPSGANSTLEPPATAPRSASWSAGGGAAAGAGGGVGAVPNEICSGLAAVAPDAATSAGLTIVTVYGVLPARWCSGVMTRSLPFQVVVTCVAGSMCSPSSTRAWFIGWLNATVITSLGLTACRAAMVEYAVTVW